MLNKFPHNLEEERRQLKQKGLQKKEVEKFRNELGDCDGASQSLVESLEAQKKKKSKHIKHIKTLLNIVPNPISDISPPVRNERKVMEEGRDKVEALANPEQTRKIE